MTPYDFLTIGTLALLEGILSVDNALVLAILVRTLPEKQRKKALTYGLAGAVFFRLLALLLAAYILKFSALKLLGGFYLIYISLKHMFLGFLEEEKRNSEKPAASFWKIVFLVEMTDIVFSIDAVTTAIAFSDKLWVLWTGGIVGIIAMRFASNLFIGLLEKFPRLEDLAYQLVFFVGTKLSLEVFGLELEKGVFWMMMVIIGVIGGSLIYRESKIIGHQKKKTEEIIQDLKSGKLELTTLLSNEKVHAELYRALIRENFIQMTQEETKHQ